jgi:hypothetical protein
MPTVGDIMIGYNRAMKMPPSILIRCEGCGAIFYVHRKQRKRKYCTHKCCLANRPPQVRANPETCLQCGMLFRRRHGETKRKFCSIHCSLKAGVHSANGKKNLGRIRKVGDGFDRKAYNRNSNRKLRAKVIQGLGGICACCGETMKGFLSLEHVGGWGKVHRKRENGKRRNGATLLRDVIRSDYDRSKFEVRCYNCNFGAAHNGGVCPHMTDKESMEALYGNCG